MRAVFLLVASVLSAHHGASQASAQASNSPQASWPGNSSALPRNSSFTLKPLYQAYSNKTPKFRNEPLIQFLSEHPGARLDRKAPSGFDLLVKRQSNGLPEGACAPGTPCTNGACCSNTGVCSYAPSSCAPDVCISNCDAKAPCGEYAVPGKATCPLSVCCSQYGFCEWRVFVTLFSSPPSSQSKPRHQNNNTDLIYAKVAAPSSSAATAARSDSEAAGPRLFRRAPAEAAVSSGRAGSPTTRAGRRRGIATPSSRKTWTRRA